MKNILLKLKTHIKKDPMGRLFLSLVKSKIKLTLQQNGVSISRVKKSGVITEPTPSYPQHVQLKDDPIKHDPFPSDNKLFINDMDMTNTFNSSPPTIQFNLKDDI